MLFPDFLNLSVNHIFLCFLIVQRCYYASKSRFPRISDAFWQIAGLLEPGLGIGIGDSVDFRCFLADYRAAGAGFGHRDWRFGGFPMLLADCRAAGAGFGHRDWGFGGFPMLFDGLLGCMSRVWASGLGIRWISDAFFASSQGLVNINCSGCINKKGLKHEMKQKQGKKRVRKQNQYMKSSKKSERNHKRSEVLKRKQDRGEALSCDLMF